MSSIRIPDSSCCNGTHMVQLERIEAELERIVGPRGTQALLARSRHLCGAQAQSSVQQLRILLQLVGKLLGQPLAHWLLQSAASVSHVPPALDAGHDG